MTGFLDDLRYGIRKLAHHPGFSALAILIPIFTGRRRLALLLRRLRS